MLGAIGMDNFSCHPLLQRGRLHTQRLAEHVHGRRILHLPNHAPRRVFSCCVEHLLNRHHGTQTGSILNGQKFYEAVTQRNKPVSGAEGVTGSSRESKAQGLIGSGRLFKVLNDQNYVINLKIHVIQPDSDKWPDAWHGRDSVVHCGMTLAQMLQEIVHELFVKKRLREERMTSAGQV